MANLASITSFGSNGTGNDNFSDPGGMDHDGEFIYICDRNNHRIIKRTLEGNKFVSKAGNIDIAGLPISGSDDSGFNNPRNIVIVGEFLYITDNVNNRIKIYDKSLKFRRNITAVDIVAPIGITSDNKFLYITLPAKLVKVSLIDFSVVRTFTDGLVGLTGISYHRDRRLLYVCDDGNDFIPVFDTDFNSKAAILESNSTDSTFTGLSNTVIIDSYVHVVESGRIQVFDTALHTSVAVLAGFTAGSGIMSFRNTIYVSDTGTDNIKVSLNYTAYRSVLPRSTRTIDSFVWYENPLIPIDGKQFDNDYTIDGIQEFDKRRWVGESEDVNNLRWR